MDKSAFKTIHASIRPARVAILVDKADEDWQQTCLRIIEFYSQLWGGAYNIIVPTDGREISEPFWTLLEAFDPDYLYRYGKSGEDWAQSHPSEYERELRTRVDARVVGGDSASRAAITSDVDKHLRDCWLPSTFGIVPELQKEIKTRLAPFWLEQYVVNAGAITAGSVVAFPLTNIAKIVSSADHPDRISVFEGPADELPPLWYAAVAGRINSRARDAFSQLQIGTEVVSFTENDLSQLIEFTIRGEIRGPQAIRSGAATLRDAITPYDLSMLELGLYRSYQYQWWQEPIVAVAGNALEDFCLYYCLSRLRDRVVWVLPSITEKALNTNISQELSRAETSFRYQLLSQERSPNFTGGLVCVTHSLAPVQVESVIAQLNRVGAHSRQIQRTEDVQSLVRLPLKALERDTVEEVSLQFSDDRSVSAFNTPKPKHFNPIHPYEHRYITQLDVVAEGPPKHSELGTSIIVHRALTTHEARIGTGGPAYFCPNVAHFGGDIDTVLVRPRLHIPPLYKLMEELAKTQGYECRPSDKGIYADETISKWGGLEQIGSFLLEQRYRNLLNQYLDSSKSAPGRGVYLDGDHRRYLDFRAMKAIVGDTAGSLIDDLISRQALYRGFIFGCGYCRNSEWFSVTDITQEFKCRRCGRTQLYRKANWKMPDEPAWFYKLDELVYQGYRQGMAVSLLALNYCKRSSERSFTFTTDREFWTPGADKPEIEVDFFCAPDGVLTVGEAKAESTLGANGSEQNAKINKYLHLVRKLQIRQIVFATLSDHWHPATIEAVTARFSGARHVRTVFLNASQLL
jgi:hypothetical protein